MEQQPRVRTVAGGDAEPQHCPVPSLKDVRFETIISHPKAGKSSPLGNVKFSPCPAMQSLQLC